MRKNMAGAVMGAVIVLSLMANAVVAQKSDAGKPQKKSKGTVKVFILAGQSNMEGWGHIRTLDELGNDPEYGYLLKKVKKNDGSFVVRDDVFMSYQRGDEKVKAPLTVGQGAAPREWIGPELMFGITMGDYFDEPVLLIKTAWGGHSLFRNFRPPSAGKPAYDVGGKPEDIGASYRKMVKEVHECLDNLDVDFPKLKGLTPEICGLVWFQGWNDKCAGKKEVLDEYCSNFIHLVQDLSAEFDVPGMPAVVGELGVDGEVERANAPDGIRAAQAKIATCPELKGRVGYVRTAPFWYPELDEQVRNVGREEARVRKAFTAQVKEAYKDKPEASDPKKIEQIVYQTLGPELRKDAEYMKARAECDKHTSNWECHYWGSGRIYCRVGHALAEAMKPLLKN